ncbi:cytochrome P450 [Kitasatospora sp. McL0602]|uniref:cytochrome P450 n=1 Tax=Kitasatospora sp. McL0602 TaxID=3439530 RepID=UPI003F8BE3E3
MNPDFHVPDLEWCEQTVPAWREHPAADFFYSSLLATNGAAHDRLRRLVGRRFTARRVAELSSTVEKTTAELLDGFADATAAGGVADFQELVGYPLPAAVVGGLVGVPRADEARFRQLGADAGRLLEPVRTPEDWARADRAVEALREYFADLLHRRRTHPADDLATSLLARCAPATAARPADSDEDPLTERELVDILVLVFVAGFETTTGLLGTAVHALLTHPDQLALVRRQPELAAAAVEESLRWDGPVPMTERIATRPSEVGGVLIPAGASITTVLAAGNRDPEQHPDPDTFTVRRQDIRVLSFSAGAHYCLGAALARLEGAALIRQLVGRFPGLALAGEPTRRSGVGLRSFERLPLATTG